MPIHVHKVTGEECGLLAAGAGPISMMTELISVSSLITNRPMISSMRASAGFFQRVEFLGRHGLKFAIGGRVVEDRLLACSNSLTIFL